jgi:hypothetical protein
MYTAEQIFQSLTYDELYYTLKSIVDEDCYLQDYLDNQTLEDFLYLLELYDIVFIASDERILLTQKGEKVLQYASQLVDLNKNHVNVLKK